MRIQLKDLKGLLPDRKDYVGNHVGDNKVVGWNECRDTIGELWVKVEVCVHCIASGFQPNCFSCKGSGVIIEAVKDAK
jgi:hypothetical protein